MFIGKGADVKVRDRSGNTPLHLAASRATAEVLLRHGADVHARSAKGETPLVAHALNPEMVRLLLTHKADPNARAEDDRKAIDHVLQGLWDARTAPLRKVRLDAVGQLIQAGTDLLGGKLTAPGANAVVRETLKKLDALEAQRQELQTQPPTPETAGTGEFRAAGER